MKKVIYDEKTEYESNKVYKYCFYVFLIGICVDVLIKCVLLDFDYFHTLLPYQFGVSYYSYGGGMSTSILLYISLEIVLLFAVVLIRMFLLAQKGVVILSKNCDLNTFPKKRYALISLIFSVSCAIIFFLIYLIQGLADTFLENFMYASISFAVVLVSMFLLSFLIFFIAFKVAEISQKKASANGIDEVIKIENGKCNEEND